MSTDTRFYAHEGHYIEAQETHYESLVAYEGYPRGHWSGGFTFATTDAVIQALVHDQNERCRDAGPNSDVLGFDPNIGVLSETLDGDTYFWAREPETGLMPTPSWTWGVIDDPSKVKELVLLDGSRIVGSTYEPDLPEVTDLDRLEYLRKRLQFWTANLSANIDTYERDGLVDSARRMRLDRAQLDDILGRIDGREDAYIASLKREGSL